MKGKKILRIIIILIFCCINVYLCFGIYKENELKLVEQESNITIDEAVIPKKVVVQRETIEQTYKGFDVIAKLEIPKINLETSVLKNYSTNELSIAPTKFWGPEPNEIGNFCIAGHNYIQKNMFKNLKNLEIGDELYLIDNKYGKYTYTIYDIYKVKDTNMSPINQQTNGMRIVTLITCVNFTDSRLIVQAIEGLEQ